MRLVVELQCPHQRLTFTAASHGGNFTFVICAGCRENLDHCHGVLVVHVDSVAECTEPGCLELDVVRHAFVVVCDESPAGGCECTAAGVTGRHRRRAA